MQVHEVTNPPAQFDGYMLAEHIKAETGYNFHNLMVKKQNSNSLFFTVHPQQMPENIGDLIDQAVATYVHPVDLAAARSLSDIALATFTV